MAVVVVDCGVAVVRGAVLGVVLAAAVVAVGALVETAEEGSTAVAAATLGVGSLVGTGVETGDATPADAGSGLSRESTNTSTTTAAIATVDASPNKTCTADVFFAGCGGAMKFGRDPCGSTGTTPGIDASVCGIGNISVAIGARGGGVCPNGTGVIPTSAWVWL